MKQAYQIPLSSDRPRRYSLFARILIIVSALLLIAVAVNNDRTVDQVIAAVAVLAALPGLGTMKKITGKLPFPAELITLALLSVCFLVTGNWFPAAMMIIASVLLIIATRPLQLQITINELSYSGLGGRKIYWAELNNVVHKDGYITIDFSNDRLIQNRVQDLAFFSPAEEQEFNEFCRQQVAAAGLNKRQVIL